MARARRPPLLQELDLFERRCRTNLPITVLGNILRPPAKSNIQVRTRTERPPSACQDNDLDALIDIEHGVELLKVLHHLPGKGVVFVRAVERDNDDRRHARRTGRMMRDSDMACCGDFLIRGRELNGGRIEYHGEVYNRYSSLDTGRC